MKKSEKILPRPSHGVLPPSRPARHWDSTKSRRGDGALKAAPRGRPHPYATNTNTNTMKSVYNVYYTLRSFYCCESFSNNLEVFIQHKVTLQWTSIDTIEERSQNFQVQLKYNKYKSKNKQEAKRSCLLHCDAEVNHWRWRYKYKYILYMRELQSAITLKQMPRPPRFPRPLQALLSLQLAPFSPKDSICVDTSSGPALVGEPELVDTWTHAPFYGWISLLDLA